MKDIIIKNFNNIEPIVHSKDGNSFNVKSVIDSESIEKCSADLVEVDPGNFAYGYHYHEENEEIFYIISGKGRVKTEKGDINLKQGDIICFPANINGSHVIFNSSDSEKLVYIDFGTANNPDVVHFMGTNAGMVISKSGVYNFMK